MKHLVITLLIIGFLSSCNEQSQSGSTVENFLNEYTTTYLNLAKTSSEAEWKANTYIMEGDTATEAATRRTSEALAAFTGSKGNIEAAQAFLKERDGLTDIQVRQLEAILYAAANNPETVADLVQERIKAETEQNTKLFGFQFTLDGNNVNKNTLNTMLKEETKSRAALKSLGIQQSGRRRPKKRPCQPPEAKESDGPSTRLFRLFRLPGVRLRHDHQGND